MQGQVGSSVCMAAYVWFRGKVLNVSKTLARCDSLRGTCDIQQTHTLVGELCELFSSCLSSGWAATMLLRVNLFLTARPPPLSRFCVGRRQVAAGQTFLQINNGLAAKIVIYRQRKRRRRAVETLAFTSCSLGMMVWLSWEMLRMCRKPGLFRCGCLW